MTLLAVLLPALLMPLLLLLAPSQAPLPGLAPSSWPPAFWIVAIAGSIGTAAGIADWRFHRGGGRRIPRAEHRAELAALGLGVPLFALLAAASLQREHAFCIVSAVAIALCMAGLIVYDEVRFHRACGRYETLLHRLLVGGNAVAFLAWLSWCIALESQHA